MSYRPRPALLGLACCPPRYPVPWPPLKLEPHVEMNSSNTNQALRVPSVHCSFVTVQIRRWVFVTDAAC